MVLMDVGDDDAEPVRHNDGMLGVLGHVGIVQLSSELKQTFCQGKD